MFIAHHMPDSYFCACTAGDQPQAPDTNSPAADDNSAGTETPGDADSTDTDL